MKVFIDFDNTLVDTVSAFVSRYNALHQKKITSEMVTEYDFSLLPVKITADEITRSFHSKFFFSELHFYPNVLESLVRMKEAGAELIMITRGTLKNISMKIEWMEKHHVLKDLFSSFMFISREEDRVDMKDSILIDDLRINHLNCNARYKFSFKDRADRKWFPIPDDGVFVYNSWTLIADDICRLHGVKTKTKNTSKSKKKTRYNANKKTNKK